MQSLHDFAFAMRRHADAAQALIRLEQDFALPATLVLAAVWAGGRRMPPDVKLAQRLEYIACRARPPATRALPSRERTAQSESGVLAALEESLCESGFVPAGRACVREWLLLVAPASVVCVEQSHWIEVIMRCARHLDPGAALR